MKRCSNGHFYDDTKYANCPFCEMGGAMNGGAAAGVTMPLSRINQQQNGEGKAVYRFGKEGIPHG